MARRAYSAFFLRAIIRRKLLLSIPSSSHHLPVSNVRAWTIVCLIAIVSLASRTFGEELASKPEEKDCSCVLDAGPEHGKLNTADASTIEPKHIELEFTYAFTHAARAWNNNRHNVKRGSAQSHEPNVTLTVGAIKNLDFNISCGYASIRDADNDFDDTDTINGPHHCDSISDTSIGSRWRFLTIEKHSLEVAWLSGITIPTGCANTRSHMGNSQEFWSLENSIVVSKDWDKWTANAEIGYSLPLGEKRNKARGTLTANIATGYQVLKWLQPEVELNYDNDFVKRDSGANMLSVTAGLVMPINERLRVNIGAQQTITGRNTNQNTTLLLGVKWAF